MTKIKFVYLRYQNKIAYFNAIISIKLKKIEIFPLLVPFLKKNVISELLIAATCISQ